MLKAETLQAEIGDNKTTDNGPRDPLRTLNPEQDRAMPGW
jgi:hypothetical protein